MSNRTRLVTAIGAFLIWHRVNHSSELQGLTGTLIGLLMDARLVQQDGSHKSVKLVNFRTRTDSQSLALLSRHEETGPLGDDRPLPLKEGLRNASERKLFHYLRSLIKTTSLDTAPRARANCLPSLDQSNPKMTLDLKSVNCFGGPPSTGWLQMLETPARVTM